MAREDELFKWLSILGRLGNLYVDQHLRDEPVKSSHHPLLFCICRRPGITQEELGRMVYLHPSNITRGLECLEREGYISRECLEEDRRTRRIYPTEKGRESYERMGRLVKRWGGLLTSGMSAAEADTFIRLLRQTGQAAADYFYPAGRGGSGAERRRNLEKR